MLLMRPNGRCFSSGIPQLVRQTRRALSGRLKSQPPCEARIPPRPFSILAARSQQHLG